MTRMKQKKNTTLKDFFVSVPGHSFGRSKVITAALRSTWEWVQRSRQWRLSHPCGIMDSISSWTNNTTAQPEWTGDYERMVIPQVGDLHTSAIPLLSTTIQQQLQHLPIDMTFNDGHILSIATYSVLLVASVSGNITVLVNLLRRKHISNPRVSIMLVHLAIADLLVRTNKYLKLTNFFITRKHNARY